MRLVLKKDYGKYVLFVFEYKVNEAQRYWKKAEKHRAEVLQFMDENAYVPTVEDVAVGMMLSEILRRKTGFPALECTPFEEPGYGLPEFSIYLNPDARSFVGRWGYDEYEPDLWLLDLDDREIKDIEKTIEELKRKYRHIAYAIIEKTVVN